jgi:hypothetical protein
VRRGIGEIADRESVHVANHKSVDVDVSGSGDIHEHDDPHERTGGRNFIVESRNDATSGGRSDRATIGRGHDRRRCRPDGDGDWVEAPVDRFDRDIVAIDPASGTTSARVAVPGIVAMTLDTNIATTSADPPRLAACSADQTVEIGTVSGAISASYPYGCTGVAVGGGRCGS